MLSMSRQLKSVILVNVLISLSFLFFNIFLWTGSRTMSMNPLEILLRGAGMDYSFTSIYPNVLFWLFWLSTAVNLYFIIRFRRNKEAP